MAIVKKYKAEIVSFVNPVDNIFAVELKSLNGPFRYLPGQFMHLALDAYDPSLGWPESRCFSMQSSPTSELVKITFAAKGKFTSRMASELCEGKQIDIKMPYGELFQQEHSKNNVVFIAGGTGITPFLSVFTDKIFQNYSNPKLYFGVREKKFHIYQNELSVAEQLNPSFRVFTKYQNFDGILKIREIFDQNGASAIYFISGPQIMITSFRSELTELGVSLNNIKTDDWE